jgi:aspartyl-tRNA(Asn)/glutamyl-tRNA(Gln) amidotransferase subunit A
MRVGWLVDHSTDMAHPDVTRLYEELKGGLDGRGSAVTVDLPVELFDHAAEVLRDISHVDLCLYHSRYASRRHLYGESFTTRVAYGFEVTGIGYAAALAEKKRLEAVVEDAFGDFDILLLPGNLQPAQPHGRTEVETPQGPVPIRVTNGRYDRLASLTGVPSLVTPVGEVDGMPVGIQVIAPWNQEARLFAMGRLLASLADSPTARWGIEVRRGSGSVPDLG